MSPEVWGQLGLFTAEVVIVASLLLTLFSLRHRLGLSPLYATLGVFQYLQVMLALSLYVEITPGISVSPGSAVLFSGSLFALLLVFLRENPTETQTLVYGLLTANLTLSLLSFLFGFHLNSPLVQNPYELPDELFMLNVRVMTVGTVTLVLDMFLLMIAYQALTRIIQHSLTLRVFATLAIVLTFDSAVFITGCFWQEPFFASALRSAVVSKVAAALIYSGFLTGYLRWVEPTAGRGPVRSFAHVLGLLLGRDETADPPDAVLGISLESLFLQALDRRLAIAEHLETRVDVMVVTALDWAALDRDLGREETDDLLRYLVAVVRSLLENKDMVGRLGPDSIAIFLEGGTERRAKALLREISEQLEESLSRIRPSANVQEIRIGVGWSESLTDSCEAQELLQLAATRARNPS